MSETEVVELWWHCYGGVVSDDNWGDVWALFILGESTKHPEALVADGKLEITTPAGSTFPYLRSYNHDPSDAEKELLTPEEYRDG